MKRNRKFVPTAARDIVKCVSHFSAAGWEVRLRGKHYVCKPPSGDNMHIVLPLTPSDRRWADNFVAEVRRHPECPEVFKRFKKPVESKPLPKQPIDELVAVTTNETRDETVEEVKVRSDILQAFNQSGKCSIATNSGTAPFYTALVRFFRESVPRMGMETIPCPVNWDACIVDNSLIFLPLSDDAQNPRARRGKGQLHSTIRTSSKKLGLKAGVACHDTTWRKDGDTIIVDIPAQFLNHEMAEPPKFAPAVAATKAWAADAAPDVTISADQHDFCVDTVRDLIAQLNEQVKLSGGAMVLSVKNNGKLSAKITEIKITEI